MNDKELYEYGMKILREHHEEFCFRVMKSRKENKGNFAYIEDDDFKREEKLAYALERFLYQLYAKLNGKFNNKGCCDKLCLECEFIRFNFNSIRAPDHWCNEKKENWYCQEECECK